MLPSAPPLVLQLREAETLRLVVRRLLVADGFWSRLCGLQFRRRLPDGTGLLLVPCGSIHTCWLRYSIDAVMLDAAGHVLRVCPEVPPWRVRLAPRGTHAVLELPGGTAQIAPGVRLVVCPTDSTPAGVWPPERRLPASLHFLLPPGV